MANLCLTCRFANWTKTARGSLHPDGSGRCDWVMPDISLPKAFYYIGGNDRKAIPRPSGGYIDRKMDDTRECPAWEPIP